MAALIDGIGTLVVDLSDADRPVNRQRIRETDDAALSARAAAGEIAAFDEIVRRHRNDVYGLAYHFVRNREDAWDISQEVFVKAYRALGRFRGDAAMRTWLMRITANQCRDFLRKRRLATVPLDACDGMREPESPGGGPDADLENRELAAAIEEALDALPMKHRTAIVLREFEGLSYQEMAEVMDCSIGTVMSRLYHARRKMQAGLERLGYRRR